MQEKKLDSLPVYTGLETCPKPSRLESKFKSLLRLLILALVAGAIGMVTFRRGVSYGRKYLSTAETFDGACLQEGVLLPQKHDQLWANLTTAFGSHDYQSKAITLLSEAIQIQTITNDTMGAIDVDTDSWKEFTRFHEYLEKAFPLVYSNLKVTKVNTYGIIYEWKGASPGLKPILLAAHQDVVPVDEDTRHQWHYRPFDGHFDGEKIWGRGASDDKCGLIGVLIALETLISHEYRPARGIVLASGFDEEIGGLRGAATLAPVLQELYKDGFAFVIDEGTGFGKKFGTNFAMVGTAEKGATNVEVKVASAGGHSSLPPDHTSIGMLSAMLTHLESNPSELEFSRVHPFYGTLQCFATHAENMPADYRKLIIASATSDGAMRKLIETISQDHLLKNFIGTTQAINVIKGGIKANALPEQAAAIVNHRISVTSNLTETKGRYVWLLKDFASQFDLSFTAFGEVIAEGSKGNLTVGEPFHQGLEPAPITSSDKPPYRLLSGTIKATFNSHRGLTGVNNIAVVPGTMPGNTDTRFYWNLSPYIFRYNHQNFGDVLDSVPKGMHTVNEYTEADSFMEMIEFFTMLILNADESTHL